MFAMLPVPWLCFGYSVWLMTTERIYSFLVFSKFFPFKIFRWIDEQSVALMTKLALSTDLPGQFTATTFPWSDWLTLKIQNSKRDSFH
jgi:hypothetical protein